jgi:YVTN family beta-propeller protein
VFESGRSGSNQLWLLAGSGEARQLTDIAAGVANPVWSRDGKKIAFVSSVWPEYSSLPFAESNAKNKKRMDDQEKNPVKAKVFTKLFYRHWDEYVEDRRQHLFIIELESVLAGGAMPTPKDLTPGDRDAYPTSSTFSVGDDFSFSPDGSHVVFTAVPKEDEAWNTRHELCRVPVTGGSTDWQGLKTASTGAENAPLFSPDGKLMLVSAEEADLVDVLDIEKRKQVASIKVGERPRGIAFSPDGKKAYVAVESASFLVAIDMAELKVVGKMSVGKRTAGVAVSPDGAYVFATNGGDANVSMVDTATFKVVENIAIGQRPWNMGFSPDGKKLYIASGRSGSVSVVDIASRKMVKEIPTGKLPWGVVVN